MQGDKTFKKVNCSTHNTFCTFYEDGVEEDGMKSREEVMGMGSWTGGGG